GRALPAIIGVGKTCVEGQVIGRVWVHLGWGHGIEALGSLAVALADFGPELAGPAADGQCLEPRIAAVPAALPDLHLRLLLVGADQDWVARRHAFRAHQRHGRGWDGHLAAGRSGWQASLATCEDDSHARERGETGWVY